MLAACGLKPCCGYPHPSGLPPRNLCPPSAHAPEEGYLRSVGSAASPPLDTLYQWSRMHSNRGLAPGRKPGRGPWEEKMGIAKIAKAVAASVETRHISASASAYLTVITSDGFDMNSPCKYAVKHPNGGGGVWMMWAEEVMSKQT